MPVTIKVNGVANSLVHKGSNGISSATIPDVCKTPTPGGPVPIPYPNISQSITLSKGTTTVKADGGMMIAIKGSEFSLSNGDEPGSIGGVKSSTFIKESTWILYSFDVKMDGQNACRLTDKKFQNHENTVDLAGVIQAPVVAALGQETAEVVCTAVCDAKENGKQEDVAAAFSDKGPLYTPKPGSNILPEVSYQIPAEKGGAFKLLKSETGRTIGKDGPVAPASMMRALNKAQELGPGNTVRWDLVQVVDPSKPASPSNVKNYIEIKFPPDDWTRNQKRAKSKMSKQDRKKLVLITPKKCGCE